MLAFTCYSGLFLMKRATDWVVKGSLFMLPAVGDILSMVLHHCCLDLSLRNWWIFYEGIPYSLLLLLKSQNTNSKRSGKFLFYLMSITTMNCHQHYFVKIFILVNQFTTPQGMKSLMYWLCLFGWHDLQLTNIWAVLLLK